MGFSLPTVKKLYARSGNRCAFPKCTIHVVEGDTVVADVCHIRAASPLGPRYDPSQSDAERHSYDNLILLCAVHHRIIDDEPGKYTVLLLLDMKRVHEATATAIPDGAVEAGARLLAKSDGSGDAAMAATAGTTGSLPAAADADQKHALLGRAAAYHRDRLSKIEVQDGYIEDLGNGRFIFNIIPVASLNTPQSPGFGTLSANPHWFAPVAGSTQDYRVDFDGLLTGSNGEGLARPQRAYTHVSRSGIVEAVASSLSRGYSGDLVMLPNIQAMLIKCVTMYMAALSRAAIAAPAIVCASLTDVNGKRLLRDFIANALPEDIPGPRLNRDQYTFTQSWIDNAPGNIIEAGHLLRPTLDHMANAAGLRASPYFDNDGNYKLTP